MAIILTVAPASAAGPAPATTGGDAGKGVTASTDKAGGTAAGSNSAGGDTATGNDPAQTASASSFAALLAGRMHKLNGPENADADPKTAKDDKGNKEAKDKQDPAEASVAAGSQPPAPDTTTLVGLLQQAAVKRGDTAVDKDGSTQPQAAAALSSKGASPADAKAGAQADPGKAPDPALPADSLAAGNAGPQPTAAAGAASAQAFAIPGMEFGKPKDGDIAPVAGVDDQTSAQTAAQAAAAQAAANAFAAPQNAVRVLDAQTLAIEPPVASRDWAPAVGTGIKLLVQNKSSVADLQVTPPDLGPINVRIDFSDKPVVAITVQHSDTKDALDAALPRLREMLSASGISIAGSGVQYRQGGSDSARQEASGRAWQPGPSSRDSGPDATSSVTSVTSARALRVSQLGAVDTYA
jgi:flagellar hook-length control protein FliK